MGQRFTVLLLLWQIQCQGTTNFKFVADIRAILPWKKKTVGWIISVIIYVRDHVILRRKINKNYKKKAIFDECKYI